MPQYGIKGVDRDWIRDRLAAGRFLPFSVDQARDASRLREGDLILLYDFDKRLVFGAVRIIGELRHGRELPKRYRTKYPLALSCDTIALVEMAPGAKLASAKLAPNGSEAWKKIALRDFIAPLAELCVQARHEYWMARNFAEQLQKASRQPPPRRPLGLTPTVPAESRAAAKR